MSSGEGEREEVTRSLSPTLVNKNLAVNFCSSFFYSLRGSPLAKKAFVDCITSDGSNKVQKIVKVITGLSL